MSKESLEQRLAAVRGMKTAVQYLTLDQYLRGVRVERGRDPASSWKPDESSEQRSEYPLPQPPPQLPQAEYGFTIEPYVKGMPLEGGFTLFGSESTAVIHYPLGDGVAIDIHHHNRGGGAVYGQPSDPDADAIGEPFRIILPWDKKPQQESG